MVTGWTIDWLWGLALIAVTLMVHAFGLVIIGLLLLRLMAFIGATDRRLSSVVIGSTLLVGLAGWMLAALHGVEAGLWALADYALGAVSSLPKAMLYSVDSITTLGASGASLRPGWSLMGPLEAADGMLLFGVSTAFLFALLSRVWQKLSAAGLQWRERQG